MAFDPKPITVEYVSPEAYDGAQDPQPFVVVGEDPSGEAPAAHTHDIEDVTNLQSIITDLTSRIEALESAGE